MWSNPFQCITLSLLIIPPILLTTYFLASFPNPPEILPVHPSLASLPTTCNSWKIYPEDFYEGGRYVAFPHGMVRYWLIGPEQGKKIVLIHGLSIPAIIWKDIVPSLVSKGYRLLLYDLYGRGYSDAPQTTYNAVFYTTQLALLMQHVKWDKTNIIGLSMGGGIAASFASMFPHLVDDHVALMASAGIIDSSDISRTAKFLSSPLVQTVASSSPFRLYLQHLANKNTSTPNNLPLTPPPPASASSHIIPTFSNHDEIQELVRIQSAHLTGYNAALASSIREGPIRGLSSQFKSLGSSGRKLLLIHGTEDTTVPYKYATRIQTLMPSSTLVTLNSAGHDLSLSHSKEVGDALIQFFES